MLNLFAWCKTDKPAANRLYAAVVTRAREPVFFVTFAVPDSFDGRFDLLSLHAWLVLVHLQDHPRLAQAFVDRVFIGFDEALRELGAGDMGMGRRMKKLADAFYGRLTAYGDAAKSEAPREAMAQALTRNLYRGAVGAAVTPLADYVLKTHHDLTLTPEGTVDFGALPEKN